MYLLKLLTSFAVLFVSFSVFVSNVKAGYLAKTCGGINFDTPLWRDTHSLGGGCLTFSSSVMTYGVYAYIASSGGDVTIYNNPTNADSNCGNGSAAIYNAIPVSTVAGAISSTNIGGLIPLYRDYYTNRYYIHPSSTPGILSVAGYAAPSSGLYGGTPCCPAASGGGVLSGTTCITDNGCAANTCTTATCNNGIATVNGTKNCNVDNGCAANTCAGSTCWNSYATVAGTKTCACVPSSWSPAVSSVCAGSIFTQTDGCTVWPATGTYAGGTWSPAPSTQCSGTSFIQTDGCTTQPATGTMSCVCVPFSWTPAASSVCAGSIFTQSNGCTTQPATGTQPVTYSNKICSSAASSFCSDVQNCGKTNTITAACVGTNSCTSNTDSLPLADCGATCVSTTETCPSCPASVYAPNSWREVAP